MQQSSKLVEVLHHDLTIICQQYTIIHRSTYLVGRVIKPKIAKRGTQKWGFLYPRRQLLRTLKSYNDEILHVGKLFGVL